LNLDNVKLVSNVLHLPVGLLVHFHLLDGCDGTEADMMLVDVMAESQREALPLLQTGIDSLMTGTGSVHEVVMRVILGVVLSDNLWLSFVSLVSNNFFTLGEHSLHLEAEDLDIGPATSIEWASIRDDVAGEDANPKLVSQSSAVELL